MSPTDYQAIFKRKSFHLFRGVGSECLTSSELEEIRAAYQTLKPLNPNLQTAIRILPAEAVHVRCGAEYCILFYSEQGKNDLMNVGYLGEQLDLLLVSKQIGTLWFGIGKPDLQNYNGMEFVIMMAIRKVRDESKFRREMFSAKRKPIEEVWSGERLGVAEIARFAPSACNTQPWFVEHSEGKLTVFRVRKPGKRGIMPIAKVDFYNGIDIGIFLCILEICLSHEEISFTAERFSDEAPPDAELIRVAEYQISKKA